MRVIERCEYFGLALKPRNAFGIVSKLIGQHLDRNVTLQFGIARPIHFTHPASTQKPNDFVRAQLCSCAEGHGGTIIREAGRRPNFAAPLPFTVTNQAMGIFSLRVADFSLTEGTL